MYKCINEKKNNVKTKAEIDRLVFGSDYFLKTGKMVKNGRSGNWFTSAQGLDSFLRHGHCGQLQP